MKTKMPDAPDAPKYYKLAEQFMARIESGQWKPGDRLPSFAQLRAEYGASRPTAERMLAILDGNGLIERQSGTGIFVAHPRARCSGIVGLCGWGFLLGGGSSYWLRLAEGIHRQAHEDNSQVLLLGHDLGKGWEKIDGLLISRADDRKVSRLLPPQMPHVYLFYAHPDSTSVVADEEGGMRAATEHLLKLGHRRIAYLRANSPAAMARVRGYETALRAAGVRPSKNWLRAMTGKNDYGMQFIASGQRDMTSWIEEKGARSWKRTGCTALLCHNDETAVGAMRALSNVGLGVPDDVSVVGFDDVEAAQFCTPTLSTVAMPLGEMGALAVQLLHEQIIADAVRIEQRVLPTHFIARDSSGPAPQ